MARKGIWEVRGEEIPEYRRNVPRGTRKGIYLREVQQKAICLQKAVVTLPKPASLSELPPWIIHLDHHWEFGR